MHQRVIHLNAHQETAPCTPALDWMRPFLEGHRVTTDFLHQIEHRALHIYDLVGAESEEAFVFTSSGAEAVNQVIFSAFLEVARKEGKTHFIASALEDAPTMQALKRVEELGCTVKIAPVDKKGKVDLEKLEELISPRTALISVTMAEGLTGVIQPFNEIAAIAKKQGALLHLDAAYAVGKLSFSFSDLGADYLTFSGDKIHALQGGALFAKKGRPLVPLILGGASLRGGPFDSASFMAFAAACSQASLTLDAMGLEVAFLRNSLEKELVQLIPDAEVLFEEELRLPNTTALYFPKAHHQALHYFLSQKNVFTSIGGTYCQKINAILLAAGVEEKKREAAISFSLSRMTTEEEIFHAAKTVHEAVSYLKNIAKELF